MSRRSAAVGGGLMACGALACGAPADAFTIAGTASMPATLAKLDAAALAASRSNALLNRERAAMLESQLARLGTGAFELHYDLAHERLAAGETREAIDELEDLLWTLGESSDGVRARSKPVFDLLGIAYLRLGEQENCALDPAASVCILPLDGEARHRKEEGARRAIALYQRLLREFPDDYGSRWLLNVAYMTLGEYPARVPRPYLIPGLDRRRTSFPRFYNIARDVGVARRGLAGGVGARVEIVVADSTGATRTLHRTVRTGGSFGSGSLRLHVGLGRATRVTQLRIIWPDAARSRSTHAELAVNRSYRVVQGRPIEALDRPPVPFRRAETSAHAHATR